MNKSKIFSKVAEIEKKRNEKVELSKDSVELAGVSDLKKAKGSVDKYVNDLPKARLSADKALGVLSATVKDGESKLKSAKAILKEFRASAKDFGIKPDSVNEYNELKSTVDFISGHTNDTKSRYLNK